MLLLSAVQEFPKKFRSHLKMLGARRVTRSKYHTEDPQKLSANVCLFVFESTAPSGPWPPHSRGF